MTKVLRDLDIVSEISEAMEVCGMVLTEQELEYVYVVVSGGDVQVARANVLRSSIKRGIGIDYTSLARAEWFVGEFFYMGGGSSTDCLKGVGDV